MTQEEIDIDRYYDSLQSKYEEEATVPQELYNEMKEQNEQLMSVCDDLKNECENLKTKCHEVYNTLEDLRKDYKKQLKYLEKIVGFIKNNDCSGAYEYAYLNKLV